MKNLYEKIEKAMSDENTATTDAEKLLLKAATTIIDRLDEDYREQVLLAADYAETHMEPVITPDPEYRYTDPDTLMGYITTLFTSTTAAIATSFNEALDKYPDVDEDDLTEELTRRKEEERENLQYVLSDLHIPMACGIYTQNTWNGSHLYIRTISNMDNAYLFSNKESGCASYDDNTIYCKNGHLREDMSHHDGTNHWLFMKILDPKKYQDWIASGRIKNMKNDDEIAGEFIKEGIADSLVPEIAAGFGIKLKDINPEKKEHESTLRKQMRDYNKYEIEKHPTIDKNVLQFIADFVCHTATNGDEYEILRNTFRNGYCYYFAKMLKTAFNRGEVCWAAPFGHFVWVDTDGTPYDIEGVNYGEQCYNIPEQYLGIHAKDFLHTPGCTKPPAGAETVTSIIRDYEKKNGLEPKSLTHYHIEDRRATGMEYNPSKKIEYKTPEDNA